MKIESVNIIQPDFGGFPIFLPEELPETRCVSHKESVLLDMQNDYNDSQIVY